MRKCIKVCLYCSSFTFVIILILLISIPYFLKDRRPYVLLRNIGDYLERLEELEDEVQETMTEDPFKDLFDNKVRPTLEALSSIKNQVAIYEKMQRIPGGPTQFIQTALKVVDETDKKIFQCENEYRLIVTKSLKSYVKLQSEFDQLLNNFYKVLDDDDEKVLQELGIVLDGNSNIQMKINLEGQTVKEVLHELANYIETKDKIEGDFRAMIRELNILDVDEVKGSKAEPLAVELTNYAYSVEEILQQSGDLLATIMPSFEASVKTIKKLMEESAEQFDRSKTRYEKIVDVMDDDSAAVRKRIENLKVYRKKDEF